jgi:hypothetical protein
MNLRDILVFSRWGQRQRRAPPVGGEHRSDHGSCLSAIVLQNGHATGSRARLATPWRAVTGPSTSRAVVTSHVSEPADIAERQFRDCLRSLEVKGDWFHCPEPIQPSSSARRRRPIWPSSAM